MRYSILPTNQKKFARTLAERFTQNRVSEKTRPTELTQAQKIDKEKNNVVKTKL